MSDAESAKKVIQSLDGHELDWRPLKIDYYRLNAKEKAIAQENQCENNKKEQKKSTVENGIVKNKDKIP